MSAPPPHPESFIPSPKSPLLDRVIRNLESYLSFHDELALRTTDENYPTFAQSIRIKALLERKRILVADDTGVNGKTFTAFASKVLLDEKLGEHHPTLVVAPNGGLLNAWSADELNRYARILNAPRQQVVTAHDYLDLNAVNADTDFVVLNWEKLSVSESDSRWATLEGLIQRYSPRYFILDECHNAKGSNSLRAKSICRLAHYTLDRAVMLLSATPIPNRYRDLGMVFHLLDPVKYPSPAMFSHAPAAIMKELLDRQVWFRLTRHDLKEELGLPDFVEKEYPVPLSDAEAELYFKAWSDCVLLGEGLTSLRKTLYDPRLSRYYEGGRITPSKLRAVAALTDDLVSDGHKVIVKTNYVEGVLENLAQAAGAGRNVVLISGETPLPERRDAILRFRNSHDYPVLVTSSVSEESIDITTGDVPCALISVEPAMTTREFIQFTGRVYRRGQKGLVTHYDLVTHSEALDQMMLRFVAELAKEYSLKVPKNFQPRTIDADMLAMRRAKEEIVNRFYGGHELSRHEQAVYDANELDRAVAHLQGLLAPKMFAPMPPFRLSTVIQAKWRNLGEEQFSRLVHTKGWRKWCRLYEEGWKDSASEAGLKVVGKLLDSLDDRVSDPVIVDMGAGAAYFSRSTGRRAFCLDLDPKFLAAGKKICDKRKIKNTYITASATAVPLSDRVADAVVNSYMLFYLKQGKAHNEIERCAMETNRILRRGGYWLVTLPYSLDEEAAERFVSHMPAYGFKSVSTYEPKQTKCAQMKSGCYILVLEKTKNAPKKAPGKDLSFYDHQVRFVQ